MLFLRAVFIQEAFLVLEKRKALFLRAMYRCRSNSVLSTQTAWEFRSHFSQKVSSFFK
jgi:hypothetical protein